MDIDSVKIINVIKNQCFTGFEDCLRNECAASVRADYIITTNIKDFEQSQVNAILADDFLKIII